MSSLLVPLLGPSEAAHCAAGRLVPPGFRGARQGEQLAIVRGCALEVYSMHPATGVGSGARAQDSAAEGGEATLVLCARVELFGKPSCVLMLPASTRAGASGRGGRGHATDASSLDGLLLVVPDGKVSVLRWDAHAGGMATIGYYFLEGLLADDGAAAAASAGVGGAGAAGAGADGGGGAGTAGGGCLEPPPPMGAVEAQGRCAAVLVGGCTVAVLGLAAMAQGSLARQAGGVKLGARGARSSGGASGMLARIGGAGGEGPAGLEGESGRLGESGRGGQFGQPRLSGRCTDCWPVSLPALGVHR
ncbi:hypothetical protein T492DRAFT_1128488 [Pavlovales sp. CCMP2436]|nr:hypothetical protein T492DRAFT_1128488 [Pavlovales sp. CCMP2436]